MIILWLILIVVTLLRILIASMGHLNEVEAYLLLCSQHLDWGFVEGPAGVPALLRLSSCFFGSAVGSVRFLAPLMMLLASFFLGSLAKSLRGEKVAWWTVIAFNVLPLANAASLVMEGTMAMTLLWIASVTSAWTILSTQSGKNKMLSWVIFGAILGIGTQVTYEVGCLLPVVVIGQLMRQRDKSNFLGALMALMLLFLGWVGPLWWNMHHDWLQWSGMTWDSFWSWSLPSLNLFSSSPLLWNLPLVIPFLLLGFYNFIPWRKQSKKNAQGSFLFLVLVPLFFYCENVGHNQPGFELLLAITALLLPGAVDFCLKTSWMRRIGMIVLLVIGCFSVAFSAGFFPQLASVEALWSFPSPRGVKGVQAVSVKLLRLRATKLDAAGHAPFLIAQTPGLAALLGRMLPIKYPEMKEAPSVFIPESQAFTSQCFLWPHYADALSVATIDPLYTEEKVTSPFLGHNALYVTTEPIEDLPQTIQGAFTAVTLIDEVTLDNEGQSQQLFIYWCDNYQMMAL